jgi:hypothetical protein
MKVLFVSPMDGLMDGGGMADVVIDGIAHQLLASMQRAVAAAARRG